MFNAFKFPKPTPGTVPDLLVQGIRNWYESLCLRSFEETNGTLYSAKERNILQTNLIVLYSACFIHVQVRKKCSTQFLFHTLRGQTLAHGFNGFVALWLQAEIDVRSWDRSNQAPGSAPCPAKEPRGTWKCRRKTQRHVKPSIHQAVKPRYFQSICNIRVLGPRDLAIGFALKCDKCSCNKHQAVGIDFQKRGYVQSILIQLYSRSLHLGDGVIKSSTLYSSANVLTSPHFIYSITSSHLISSERTSCHLTSSDFTSAEHIPHPAISGPI